MPRPPKKKVRVLAKAQRMGELQAEREFHKKKPLQESLREHIGKIIDNVKIPDAIDAVLYGALAWLSYENLSTTVHHEEVLGYPTREAKMAALKQYSVEPFNTGNYTPEQWAERNKQYLKIQNSVIGEGKPAYDEIIKYPESALFGPVCLKLATTMGGTPPLSQIVGLLGLGSLGIISTGALKPLFDAAGVAIGDIEGAVIAVQNNLNAQGEAAKRPHSPP